MTARTALRPGLRARSVRSGSYFVRLVAVSQTATGKLLVTR